jgi:preprotein translocase subunit SecD
LCSCTFGNFVIALLVSYCILFLVPIVLYLVPVAALASIATVAALAIFTEI